MEVCDAAWAQGKPRECPMQGAAASPTGVVVPFSPTGAEHQWSSEMYSCQHPSAAPVKGNMGHEEIRHLCPAPHDQIQLDPDNQQGPPQFGHTLECQKNDLLWM